MMKIFIMGFIILFLFTANTYAQSDDYTKWIVRARGIYVSPSPGDNLDGAKVNISSSFVPELDFTYFINKHLAVELILATTKHNVDVNAGGDKLDLGHVWLLPPTLSLQYHFYTGKLKPYLGAGVNYTFFYGIDEGIVVEGMDYDNFFGFAIQAGTDYDLNERWFINVDFKKIFLSIDVEVDTGGIVLPVEVDIDPFIFGVGVGYRLNW